MYALAMPNAQRKRMAMIGNRILSNDIKNNAFPVCSICWMLCQAVRRQAINCIDIVISLFYALFRVFLRIFVVYLFLMRVLLWV